MAESPVPVRLAYFVSHPIQYQAPLLQRLATRPGVELEVFFYSDFSLTAYHDKEFGRAVQWDVPLAEGYRHTFLSRVADGQPQGRWEAWRRALFTGKISRLLRAGRFDAVWVHGWGHWESFQAVRAARRLGLVTLLRGETNALAPPGETPGGLKAWLKGRARGALLAWLFRRVDGFLAIGTLNRQFYESRGVPTQRIFSVPYVVDNAFFQERAAAARPHREALRAQLGLPPGRPVILFAAKLIGKKRPRDLLAAYRRLSPDGGQSEPPACLLYVGDGALAANLRREAEQTGWRSVCFVGFRNQSELPAFYDLCDVFVLPSDFEPWGLVLNEAMNAARPVVASDRVGAAADLVQPGRNGFVYPAGNDAALAQRLSEVLAAPDRRQEMGACSLDLINAWGLEEACCGIEKALATLCPRRQDRGLAPSTTARSRPFRKIAFAGAIVFLLLAATEILLRVLCGLGSPALVQKDNAVGYLFQPDQDIVRFGRHIQYNHFSQRSPAVALTRRLGTVRVLLLGDSILNGGNPVDQLDTISELLRSRLTAAGTMAEVLAASAGGWALRNRLEYLRKFGLFDSSVVILEVGTNDLLQPFAPSAVVDRDENFPSHRPRLAIGDALERYVWPLYVRPRLVKIWPAAFPAAAPPPEELSSEGQFSVNLGVIREMVNTVRRAGKPCWVLYIPDQTDLSQGQPMARHEDELLAMLRDERVPVVTLLDEWLAQPRAVTGGYFRDEMHLTVAGDRVVADALAAALLEKIKNGLDRATAEP